MMSQFKGIAIILTLAFTLLIVGCEQDKGLDIVEKTEEIVTIQKESESEDEKVAIDAPENPLVMDETEVVESEDMPVDKVQEIMDEMTIADMVGQLYFISLTTYYQLDQPAVGGVIYFEENMTSAEEIFKETETLQLEAKLPLFISIDEEGGIVSRLTGAKGIGGTQVPSPWSLGEDSDLKGVYTTNKVIASELSAIGINMDFAPVADVRTNMSNVVIGKRAYSSDANKVADYVTQASKAYYDYGIIPVLKHYPGHGDTQGDSHKESVYVTHDYDRLSEVELLPYKQAIEQGCVAIMVGHIKVPEVTKEDLPASLSKELIDDILVDNLGFEGIIISDALNMKGISLNYSDEEVVDYGLEAGLDMFLMPEDYERSYAYMLELAKSDPVVLGRVEASVYKILALKQSFGILEGTRSRTSIEAFGSETHRALIEDLLK